MKQFRSKCLFILLTCFIVITSASLTVQAVPGENNVGIELKEKETSTSTSISTTTTTSTTTRSTETITSTSTSTPRPPVVTVGGGGGMIKYLPQTDEAPQNRLMIIVGALLVIVSGFIFCQRQRKIKD